MIWPTFVFPVPDDGPADVAPIVDRIAESLSGRSGALLLFVSSYELGEAVLGALLPRIQGVRVFGASSSGVIGPGVLAPGGVAAMFLPGDRVRVHPLAFHYDVDELAWARIIDRLNAIERELGLHQLTQPAREGLVLLFNTGLHQTEELVSARIHMALPDLPLVGGTASDGLRFERTFVIDDGRICEDHNLILVARSRTPFTIFHHHHFSPSGRRVVVTGLGDNPRVVTGLDGWPAKEGYARALGLNPSEMTVEVLARTPLGVKLNDRWFIRGVYRIAGDHLVLAGAVEMGAVLGVMQAGDIVGDLAEWAEAIGPIAGGLVFNCLGRFLECRDRGVLKQTGEVLTGIPVCGMNTYGEQYMGLHLNHTLTGVYFSLDRS